MWSCLDLHLLYDPSSPFRYRCAANLAFYKADKYDWTAMSYAGFGNFLLRGYATNVVTENGGEEIRAFKKGLLTT